MIEFARRRRPAALVATLALVCIFAARAGAAAPPNVGAAARNPAIAAEDWLERAARERFGPLSAAEIKLVRSAPERELQWIGPSDDPNAPSNDPAKAASWGSDRSIRATIVCWLVTDHDAAELVHPSGIGIAGARIIGPLDLSYQRVLPPITILSSAIAGGVDISFAHLNSLDLGRSHVGSISAQQANVAGDVLLEGGDYGGANFFRARIGGSLDFSGANLRGDAALSAVEASIDGDALFHNGFTTTGVLDFRLARVGRALSFHDARFVGAAPNGLNAERAQIAGPLYWVDVAHTPDTILDLNDARADSLWDDAASWPAAGNLNLAGFVYGEFSGGPVTASARLAWLRRQPRSLWADPQPYRELARALRANGAEEDAIEVEIAQENALTNYGNLSLGHRLWRETLRATIGYGYRPLRALWWIAGFVAAGAILFGWGYRAGLITPTEADAYAQFCQTGTPPPHYPRFSGFIYSLENFLPVVDLHQGTYWRPNPARGASAGGASEAPASRFASLLRIYLWLHILAGWTITPLLFAGLSGLLRSS